ncbi:MAG TPA: dTMP kinase [Acidimicrobiales bacterium]
MTETRGRLVALEGIDGCGKSTQARLLAERLGAVSTFEPGATPLGASLRTLLLGRDGAPVAPRAEALLMAADRAQHVADVVAPALEAGRWVVTDRYSASTLAYQGFGRGLDRRELDELVGWATGGIRPDLTVLFDLPVPVATARRSGVDGGAGDDRMEAEGLAFQQRVADGYLALAAEGTDPWLVVDATEPVEVVAADVWRAVEVLAGPGRPQWRTSG